MNRDRWLLPYSILMTLLFGLFVVLYASVRAEKPVAQKVERVSEPAPQGDLAEFRRELESELTLELGVSSLADALETELEPRGLVIKIVTEDFFASGDWRVRPDLAPIVDRIGRALARTRWMVRIEGHTDATEFPPVRKADFGSGSLESWELSARRAAGVAMDWTQKLGFNPRQIGVAGFSHFQPLTLLDAKIQTDSEWSRGKNRRLEIIVTNEKIKAREP